MFAPTKTWRKWHRKVAKGQRRYAVASALAASADVSKTSAALKLLAAVGAGADLAKARGSKKVRTGKGKMRNRRYVSRRGPLLVHAGASGAGPATSPGSAPATSRA